MHQTLVSLILLLGCLVPTVSAQWPVVPAANFSSIQLSQFNDQELEVPYFLYHFAQVANAVVETGPDKGFLDIKVNRQPADNEPYNARVMEMQMPVAYFYTANRPWNSYYGHASVRVRLEAMLQRWTEIQNQPGSADGNYDGLYSEYSATNWSLAPTSFGVMHAAQALDLIIDSGLDFDATVLENARVSLRRALMALFTRADMRDWATRYSNQFNGSYHAALLYLENWPDVELDAAFVQAVSDSSVQDQSPAGFYYERDGSDIGYSGVHEYNLRVSLPRLRQRADLMPETIASDERWHTWLSANLVPQPDSSAPLYLSNAGINTRTSHAYQNVDNRPLSELVPGARPFCRSSSEFAAYLVSRRSQVQAQFGNWGALAVPSASSYNTGFVFDAIQNLNVWQPAPAQRAGAFNQLPTLASDRFNRVFHDGTTLTVTTARRPSYYGVFNSGALLTTGQNFGLGLLWNERFGTALQAVALTGWDCGTRRTGGDGSVYENSAITVTRMVNGAGFTPVNGIRTLEDGRIEQTYALGTYGTKTVTFEDSCVDVDVVHTGGFSELLPLVHPSSATVTQSADEVVVTQANGSSLAIAITGGPGTITVGSTSSLTAGLVRRLVTLTGNGSLHYQLRLSSGPSPFKPGVPTDVAILTKDTAAAIPVTLSAVSFAPPEAAPVQVHGRVAIDAATAIGFPPTNVQAVTAVAPEVLAALPGFLVQTDWTDTQVPANSFQAKGTATGITNYQVRADPAKTAIRYQVNANTASNTSAGAVTTGATLLGSAGNSIYLGAFGAAFGNVAITFGRHAVASQNAATLAFSTTDAAGRPLAVRAAGFVLAGVNDGRSFSVEFRGIRGQRLAVQTATGNSPSSLAKLYFGYDAGPNPAEWISAIVIDGDNTGTTSNLGLDDFGATPVTSVDAGSATIVNNQLRFTPSATYLGPVRYGYSFSYPDGTTTTNATGSGEFDLNVIAPVWTNATSALPLSWSDGENWANGTAPASTSTNQPAFFTGATLPAGTIHSIQDVAVPLRLNTLALDGIAPASGAASVNLTGGTLDFAPFAGSPANLQLLANQSASGNLAYVISNPVSLTSDLTVSGDGTADFRITGQLSGAVAFAKSGTSRVTLAGANVHTGTTSITGGTLRVAHPSALGTSNANINLPGGTTLAAIEIENTHFARPVTLAMHNTTGHAQLRNIRGDNVFSGALSLNGGGARWEISSIADSLTISGNTVNINTGTDTWRTLYLNGPGNGVFTGGMTNSVSGNSRLNLSVLSGSWTFSGTPKTYTGFTSIVGGSLRVDTSMASAITTQSGGEFSGSGSTSADLIIQTGATIVTRVADWNTLPAAFTAARLVATGATSWTLRIDSTGLGNFTETARTIPVVTTTAGLVNLNPANIILSAPSFPGLGGWILSVTVTGIALVYTPTPNASWTSTISWAGGDSSPNSDPDFDGLVNLLEYALGGNPVSSASAPLPAFRIVGGKLSLTFTRTLANTDITMTVQAADSPVGPWTDLASSVNGAAFTPLVGGANATETGAGATRTVEVSDVYLTNDPARPRRFLRLSVRQ